MASRDVSNLRHANTSSSPRELRNRNSNTVSGGTWMWYFMLNCVNAVPDVMGGGCNSQECSASSSSSSSYSSSAYSSSTIYNNGGRDLSWDTDGHDSGSTTSTWSDDGHSSTWTDDGHSSSSSSSSTCKAGPRCKLAPHLPAIHKPKPPHKPQHKKSGSSSSGGKSSSSSTSNWADDAWTGGSHTDDSTSDGGDHWSTDGWETDDGSGSGNDGEAANNSGDTDDATVTDDATGNIKDGQNSYLANENNGGGNGAAIKTNGLNFNVWPYFACALVVAAALIVKKVSMCL